MSIRLVDIVYGKTLIKRGKEVQDIADITSITFSKMSIARIFECQATELSKDDIDAIDKYIHETGCELIDVKIITESPIGTSGQSNHYIVSVLPKGSYKKYVQFKYNDQTPIFSPLTMTNMRKIWEGESGARFLLDDNTINFIPRDSSGELFNVETPDRRDIVRRANPIMILDDSIEEKKKEYMKNRILRQIESTTGSISDRVLDYVSFDEIMDMMYQYSKNYSSEAMKEERKTVIELSFERTDINVYTKAREFGIVEIKYDEQNDVDMYVCREKTSGKIIVLKDEHLRTPLKTTWDTIDIYYIDGPGALEDAIEVVKEYMEREGE